MSKYIFNKKLQLKPIVSLNKSANNFNQYINESMGINTQNTQNNDSNIPFSLSINNITINYSNHYSPLNRSPISLPPIPKKNEKITISHKKLIKDIKISKFNPKKTNLKTLNNKEINNKINNNNIYVHTEEKNEEQKNKSMTIELKNYKKLNNIFSLLNNSEKNNVNQDQNLFINRKKNKNLNKIFPFYSPIINKSNKNDTKTENSIDNPLSISNNFSCISNDNIKIDTIKEIIKQKIISENDKIKKANNYSLSTINYIKLNNINGINKNSKLKSFENNINSLIKEEKDSNNKQNIENKQNVNKDIDYSNQENIDTSLNFLKDLTTDKNNIFINFLILIQTHLDIELLFDSMQINNNINTFRKKKQINNNSNLISIPKNKLFKLKDLVNSYFNTLSIIYKKNINIGNTNEINYQIDNFFLFPIINNIFHKCFKVQICLYSIILISLNQLTEYEINILIKNYLTQLVKQISFPILIIYENFVKDEINLKYQELLGNHLKKEFNENIQKLLQERKITLKNNCSSNNQLLEQISKDLDKGVYSLQYYISTNLKNSEINIFGDALNQIMQSIDTKSLNQIAIIILDTIIFSELEENHNKMKNSDDNIKNSINDCIPFLPNINPKYKYTLVLDMDETLIHFFFTKNFGMFFIRPYCFEFLSQLSEFYEIITFTAGTKEYADYILNLLDPNNEIIKYRLYRQHVTILGSSVYKDLNKLGRDLSKIIIIDNMKDNFQMQPNNGLYVKTWINDINDYQFKDLMKILKDIVLLNVSDVRPIIEKINEEILEENNLINPYYNINIENIINKIQR